MAFVETIKIQYKLTANYKQKWKKRKRGLQTHKENK